jgi:hypothetical protein
MMVYKHSLNSSEHFEQSIFLATGYLVNTYIINNGQIITELTSIRTSDISEKF